MDRVCCSMLMAEACWANSTVGPFNLLNASVPSFTQMLIPNNSGHSKCHLVLSLWTPQLQQLLPEGSEKVSYEMRFWKIITSYLLGNKDPVNSIR